MERNINAQITMEVKIFLAKIILGTALIVDNAQMIESPMKISFYALGIILFCMGIYSWIQQEVNYKRWSATDFDPKQKDKFRIK